jgi:hypothetical protein
MEKRWVDRLGHEVADHEAPIRRAVVSSVPCHTLAIGWRGIRPLTDAGQNARQNKRAGVERVTSSECEFFTAGERFGVFQTRVASVIRNNPENTFR